MFGFNSTTILHVNTRPGALRIESRKFMEAMDYRCYSYQDFPGTSCFSSTCWKWVITASVLTSQVLPAINGSKSAQYGGFMLWSKCYDNGYSSSIKNNV
ncbi:hypothetical protein Ddye_017671 [Dipteronia dyeriana]|uniref:Uncharacterized protein n=1 Tax=Dipteronia dyeriana TaxID=168575 RepID=A0AAD9U961_9ROSI|nr:hypothetical protein Ddye_017671 [Dipteronia dyeriana]